MKKDLSVVELLFMSKVADFFANMKNNWNENKTAKLAKILSFLFGLVFGIIGIILVAVWKYIFSNNENTNKHCIKLAVIGAITKFIICAKIFAMQVFGFNFPFNDSKRPIFHKHAHHIAKPDRFDDFFEYNFNEMGRAFDEMGRAFDESFGEQERMFSNAMKEMENFEKEAQKNTKRTKKVSIDKDGFKQTTIEEKSPKFYKKVVIKEGNFNGKNDFNGENKNEGKKDKSKNNIKKADSVKKQNKNSKKGDKGK